ncbi:MAG: DUF1294 domain-containing protein [Clostridiales bacterium]|jgi:uncharacterized membrane protein YsdA (DUF1294 family)|nr:DUF1294 domain-containing protein [Clostridiales bacterium]
MKDTLFTLGTVYMLIMSVIGFVSMGMDKKRSMDKRKSIKRGWRIPERTLIFIAFLGGALGSFLGMHIFSHKTKHIKFIILIPLALLLNILLCFSLKS